MEGAEDRIVAPSRVSVPLAWRRHSSLPGSASTRLYNWNVIEPEAAGLRMVCRVHEPPSGTINACENTTFSIDHASCPWESAAAARATSKKPVAGNTREPKIEWSARNGAVSALMRDS